MSQNPADDDIGVQCGVGLLIGRVLGAIHSQKEHPS